MLHRELMREVQLKLLKLKLHMFVFLLNRNVVLSREDKVIVTLL